MLSRLTPAPAGTAVRPASCALSVVLASRNRADALTRTLEALLANELPGGSPWEIVLIDNDSTDGTRTLVQELAATSRQPVVRYVFEARRGKSNALNTGIAAARGEILAFLDDDCIPTLDWIAGILREFDADPDLAMIGGRVELLDPDDLPMTIKRFSERSMPTLADFTFGVILGANMAIRRAVFERIGGFDPDLGPGQLGGADDDDVLYRVLRAGFKVVRSPDLLVHHAHGRKGEAAARALQRAYDRGHGGFYAKRLAERDWAMLKPSYWELTGVMGGIARHAVRRRWPREDLSRLAGMARGATVKLWRTARRGRASEARA